LSDNNNHYNKGVKQMKKSRLTLLLTDDQIYQIKVKAAIARKSASRWIIDQLDLDEPVQEPEPPPVQSQVDDDRDRELIKIYESLPGRENAQARADALNKAGVPRLSGIWTKKNAGDAYRKAKSRMGGA
jgi:hypothetical protein